MEDTIAAISTPIGEGGIAIIRLSGPNALTIADAIFVSPHGKPSDFPTHTIHYGTIQKNGAAFDEVMLSVMRGPKTYTAEDVVEINCHGGILTARQILASCFHGGARLAEPGEFTKRAFLNGRIDLAQAESVMDVISSRTELAHTAAISVLTGRLSKVVDNISDQLLTILAHVEAHIDFPEDDISPDTYQKMEVDIRKLLVETEKLLLSARDGKVLRHGISAAIVGRPNVGKSSLLNALLGEERAIVTKHPGTTRDTIEELTDIQGIPVYLIDTAGIRTSKGIAEWHGIERSRKALITSDIVLLVFDGSRPISQTDVEITSITNLSKTICVINKADLPQKLHLPKEFQHKKLLSISTVSGFGISDLKLEIEQLIWSGRPPVSSACFGLNERHADAIKRAHCAMKSTLNEFISQAPLEIIAHHLRYSFAALGEVTGRSSTEDLLDRVFSTFCIGK